VLWDVPVADPKTGYSITGAPLIVKDMVITGIAGGEYGIRGFLDAYDVRTGERRWRFNTIPGPGEKGHETWPASGPHAGAWKQGGGSTWVTGSFDPESNLVIWGVGNPSPD
jgi:alcohol dehydrogenase (cytochrome c)